MRGFVPPWEPLDDVHHVHHVDDPTNLNQERRDLGCNTETPVVLNVTFEVQLSAVAEHERAFVRVGQFHQSPVLWLLQVLTPVSPFSFCVLLRRRLPSPFTSVQMRPSTPNGHHRAALCELQK